MFSFCVYLDVAMITSVAFDTCAWMHFDFIFMYIFLDQCKYVHMQICDICWCMKFHLQTEHKENHSNSTIPTPPKLLHVWLSIVKWMSLWLPQAILPIATAKNSSSPNKGAPQSLRNTGTSKRSARRPLGEESYPSVDMGNKLATRTLIIIWIVAAMNVWWFVEQPQGSWMESHPCFQEILKAMTVHRHRFTMGSYGGKSEKPTWLYSSDLAWDSNLYIFRMGILWGEGSLTS